MNLRDDPINLPLLKQLSEPKVYGAILRNKGIRMARYLIGQPEDGLSDCYEEGMYVPQLSYLRHALTLLAMKHPEHEELYLAYCDIYLEAGADCQVLTCYSDAKVKDF